MQRANLLDEMRKPVMLEINNKLTELIIWDCHYRVKHNGVRDTLVEFQSRYWVTNCRSFVKKILHRCVVCRYLNSRSYAYPNVLELPDCRFNEKNAFSVVGVDHFGVIRCKSNFRSNNLDEDEGYKCYVVLHTSASTRGVILGLVPDTSSKEFIYLFIDSLKRFIARRWCPVEILSDNGSAFTAAETQKFVTGRNLSWKFTLAKALWYGGIWERLIQSTKRCLKRVIGSSMLTVLEMQPVLLEIEFILNSRPLCPLYDDDFEEPFDSESFVIWT